MSQQYELTTLRDIFDKVPADRIQECCRELGMILAQTKALAELAGALADEPGALPVTLAFPIVWTDDNKGELVTTMNSPAGELLRLETTMGARA